MADRDGVNPRDAPPLGPLMFISGFDPVVTSYRFNEETGALQAQHSQTIGGRPSFLAFSPDTQHLFAVDEQDQGVVKSFSFETDGSLHSLNTLPSSGQGPTHLTTVGAWILVAHYDDGTVTSFPVHADGSLGQVEDKQHAGKNAHEVVVTADGAFVFVPCLGSDYIAQYRFNGATGKLTPNHPPQVFTPHGSGPRHLALHPNGRFAYLLQELSSTITAYAVDPVHGTLHEIQTISNLPKNYTGPNTAAEIAVHPNGRFLFASNRGDDSIVTIALSPDSGRMTWAGRQHAGGHGPRDFTLDPSGRYLLAVNQKSNNVVVFAIDQTSGGLTELGRSPTSSAPSFVGFASTHSRQVPAPSGL